MSLNDIQVDCTGYDLALGSVNGYRRWRVDRLGRLRAVHFDHVWRPGENVAACQAKQHGESCGMGYVLSPTIILSFNGSISTSGRRCGCPLASPTVLHDDQSCPCGFYAFLDRKEDRFGISPEKVRWWKRQRGYVDGIVEGYGRTLIGSKGFRCEKAVVRCLVIPAWMRLRQRALVKRLRRNYPDVMFAWTSRGAARRFGVSLRVEQSPETDPDFWERRP